MSSEKPHGMDWQQYADIVDLRGILLLLRRQLRLILLTVALVLGVAFAYLITATPMYTARALLMVDPAQRNLLDEQQYGVSNAQTDNAKIDSEVEIIRSPSTSLAVIDAADLVDDEEFGPSVGFSTRMKIALGLQTDELPTQDVVLQGVIQRLNNATVVRRLGLTYLISVEVTSKDPARAAFLANTIAKTYITNQVQSKINASLAARDVLQGQVDAGREVVAASDAALDTFIEENLLALEQDAGNPRVAELRQRLEARRAQLLSQEGTLRAASTGLQQRNFEALAESLANEAVNELLVQRESIASQLAEAADGSEEFVNLQAELSGIEAELEDTANDVIQTLRGGVSEKNNELNGLRAELRTALLQSDLSSESLAQIFELQQAATNARSQYQNILTRLAEIENQAAVQVAQSRVVSEALPPAGKSSPKTQLIVMLALVAGLGLGVGIAFLNEYYIGGIVNPAQLEQVTGLQVASVVPKVSDSTPNSASSVIVREPLSGYSESLRRLRAVLDQDLRSKWRDRPVHANTDAPKMTQLAKGQRQGSVIMVTSSVPAEGKSTLSLSLARVYALADLKVIIIDADLRKPSIANLVNIETELGLLNYLMNASAQNSDLSFGIEKDSLTSLDCVLGAGRAKVPTDQLLSSPSFGNMIEKLRQEYDLVIIDTPPLLPVVDARYAAYHADAVVMPVRWAATSQSDLRGAISMLKPVIGKDVQIHLVLSQNEQAAAGYGYGYGYQGYYGE